MHSQPRRLQSFLSTCHPAVFNAYAMAIAFLVYFCMYGFRKPFAAGTYDGLSLLGSTIDLKTAFIISQILGYALSKYLGVKFCPEVSRRRRALLLFGLVMFAEAALVAFAVLPPAWKVLAMFFNGLPLGMIWGLVVWFLEGRRTSEFLLAGLSCSFIIASGVVKGIGVALIEGQPALGPWLPLTLQPVPEFWMPAVVGALFALPFTLFVWMLDQLPEPNTEDIRQRSARRTMSVGDRIAFVKRYLPGLLALVVPYVLLTAFRDFRDNYQKEVLIEMKVDPDQIAGALTSMETKIAFGVLAVMAAVYFIRDNSRALLAIVAVIGGGLLLMGAATLLRQRGAIDAYRWLMLLGLGAYLAYVPYNTVLFDRFMASTRAVGTAVFAIYVADALGYTGSVAVLLFSDLAVGDMSRLRFLEGFSYAVSIIGAALIGCFALYLICQKSAYAAPQEVTTDPVE
ncbi:MAG: DUF5690 family protein [Planctomycetota bacterium]